jgi:hypothetical protein
VSAQPERATATASTVSVSSLLLLATETEEEWQANWLDRCGGETQRGSVRAVVIAREDFELAPWEIWNGHVVGVIPQLEPRGDHGQLWVHGHVEVPEVDVSTRPRLAEHRGTWVGRDRLPSHRVEYQLHLAVDRRAHWHVGVTARVGSDRKWLPVQVAHGIVSLLQISAGWRSWQAVGSGQ